MPNPPASNPKQFIQGAPVLYVTDVKATAAFYRDVLGFEWDFGDENYSVVWRDNAAIHFAKDAQAATGLHIFLWVRDVDAYHREIAARGASVTEVPTDRPYGIRDFSMRDPNGVKLVFGQDVD